MTEEAPKKSNRWLVVFVIFLIFVPIITVTFSKLGLDRFKQVRAELAFLPDSIRVEMPQAWLGERYNPREYQNKAILCHFLDSKGTNPQASLQALARLQKALPKEDPARWLIVSYVPASAPQEEQFLSLSRDTSTWKYVVIEDKLWEQELERHGLSQKRDARHLALLTPQGYLAKHYDSQDEADFYKITQHLAIIIPKQERKSIEFRADKDYFK